ncbi:hypothetical protein BDZ94DRAFT_1324692 [Collybia nuda]|uniref:Uncharacterized protein n=1 Tax=Collybia nuda TaxID=64659 RepID=A0A9P6CBG9_9AGAR|nr:hypothetical protein BDZ94DRAFT_1324692 [Collybia nuda]
MLKMSAAPPCKKTSTVIANLDVMPLKSNDKPSSDDDKDPEDLSSSSNDNSDSSSDSGVDREGDEEEDGPEIQDEDPVTLTPPPTVPQKQKRGQKPKSASLQPEALKTITYILSIIPASQSNKPASKRVAMTASVQLTTDEPWSTMEAQILVKISKTLNPKTLDFKNYDAMFHILRVLPKPGMSLANETDYGFMIQRACNLTTRNPTINITINEIPAAANNATDKENTGSSKVKGQGKKKKQKEAPILPGNTNKNAHIQSLRDEWQCNKPTPSCVGSHCYINPNTSDHLPLSHERFDCWASAMLKGDEHATLFKPPNHRLFDPINVPISPVLQRRIEASKGTLAAPPPAPVFNLNIGNELIHLLRPPAPPPPNPPSVAAPAHAPAAAPLLPSHLLNYNPECPTLLHPSRSPGEDMLLSNFCNIYNLGQRVLDTFTKNSYKTARTLHFVTIAELKEMGFQFGEIAGLRNAIETWSVAK